MSKFLKLTSKVFNEYSKVCSQSPVSQVLRGITPAMNNEKLSSNTNKNKYEEYNEICSQSPLSNALRGVTPAIDETTLTTKEENNLLENFVNFYSKAVEQSKFSKHLFANPCYNDENSHKQNPMSL